MTDALTMPHWLPPNTPPPPTDIWRHAGRGLLWCNMLLGGDLLNCRGPGRACGLCLLPLGNRDGSAGRLFVGVEEQGMKAGRLRHLLPPLTLKQVSDSG